MLVNIDSTNPSDSISFQYFPMALAPKRKAAIASHQVAGRNTESLHFTGGSKHISIAVDFVPEVESREDVVDRLSILESWTYNEGFKAPAPRIKLIFGSAIREELWVVESVDTDMKLFDKRYGLRPNSAVAVISLRRWAEYNILRSDIVTTSDVLNQVPTEPWIGTDVPNSVGQNGQSGGTNSPAGSNTVNNVGQNGQAGGTNSPDGSNVTIPQTESVTRAKQLKAYGDKEALAKKSALRFNQILNVTKATIILR